MALVVLLLPPIWLATPVGGRRSTDVTLVALPSEQGARPVAGFAVEALWQLSATNENFGGYSALRFQPRNGVRLFSDRGWILTIGDLGAAKPVFKLRQLYPKVSNLADWLDIEAVTHDGATGRYWVGYEGVQAIHRYSPSGQPEAYIQPEFMRDWSVNGSIEALARLRDGRFILLRESEPDGYLYPGDPVEGAQPVHFQPVYPEDFQPVDMAQLPDGRVLVLMRRVSWNLPPFESLLAMADPAAIRAGQAWQLQPLLRLEDVLPRENYEGLSIQANEDGTVDLWLVSDDNRSFLQRTLLARLRWDPRAMQ